ncbi:MAG: septal ring lytic transglycosylase RlpA family protein [Akkermansia sp.]|nr:septal ring lytic transglycosylase RlpA family protein [Akkermansia sp.]MDO4752115.1 septal ring lytic transglycosylase RlpA family protein [Akkermansia sp.]
MNSRFAATVAMVAVSMLAACQSARHEPYKGYKKAPYTVKGHRFVPMDVHPALSYRAEGIASFYEANGAKGAIGERLYKGEYYAAHRTLPLPCMVRITSLTTGKSVEARVADRGPFVHNRLIDVSSAVARDLGFTHKGLDRVRVEVLSVGDGQYRVKK